MPSKIEIHQIKSKSNQTKINSKLLNKKPKKPITTPKVSIVVPSLNSIAYIHECIDSILNQTLKDIEIICVDAGSSDGTLEVLREYERKDSRLKVIVSSKKSYGYQMNLGIKEARGEYLGIVESDDYIKENMYERLYEIAKKYDCEVVKSDYCRFAYGNVEYVGVIKPHFKKYNLYNALLDPRIDFDNIFRGTIGINQIGIYQLDLFQINQIALNETPGASYQDNGLWFQIFAFAKSAYFLNEAFYMLRRDNPNSSVKNATKVYELCKEYDFIRDFLRKYPEIEKRLVQFCSLHRFGNYCWTLSRIEERFKIDFLKRWSKDFKKIQEDGEIPEQLLGESNMRKLDLIMKDPVAYYYLQKGVKGRGAIERVKSQLSYRIGETILEAKTPFRVLILPYSLLSVWQNHRLKQKVYHCMVGIKPSLKLKPLYEYEDYFEALQFKKHLSYRLGEVILKSSKQWYKGKILTLPFSLIKTYRKFQIERKNKTKVTFGSKKGTK